MFSDIINWYRLEDIYNNSFIDISDNKGIYIVKVAEGFTPVFLETTTAIENYKDKNMVYDASKLKEKYNNSDQHVLYIGKSGGRSPTLKKRIRQLIRYGYEEVKNQRGGRAIWQIENNKELLLGYMEFEQPEMWEKYSLIIYKEKYGVFPVANWQV